MNIAPRILLTWQVHHRPESLLFGRTMNGEDRLDTTQSLALSVAMFNSKTLPNVGIIRKKITAMLIGMELYGSGGKSRLVLNMLNTIC